MKAHLVTIFDEAAAIFAIPTAQATQATAIRWFTNLATNPGQVSEAPADYTLFELGMFDQATGKLEPHPAPKNLGNALALSAAAHTGEAVESEAV